MKKEIKINNKKIWIGKTIGIIDQKTQQLGTVVNGDCEICHQFPCKHIDTQIGNWKIKEIKKND